MSPHPANPLRIALVTGNYNSVIDGVALTMNRLVGFLERSGVPVRVFAPVAERPAFPHQGTVVPIPSMGLPNNPYRLALGLPPSARRALRAFSPTIIHLCTPDLLGIAALRWAGFQRIPAVATCHTHFSSYLKYYRAGFLEPLVWRLQRAFYRRCAEVYVATESMAEELRRHRVEANLVHAPFGVDPEQFHPGNRSMEWRRSLGIRDDEVVVCFVGRVVREKGLAVFADVVNNLKSSGVKFRTLVVGDGAARPALQQKLPDAIFTGYLGVDQVGTAFASSDIFLYPSASETFGCVTVEAMASGVPVVVADATGSRDIVRNGVDGLVCPPEDRTAFTLVVRRLIENRAARATLARAGIRRAAGYQWDHVHSDMLANYRRVLGTWRR